MNKMAGINRPNRRRRNESPLEAKEQEFLFRWAEDMAALKWSELRLMYHVPNGGSRNKIEAANLKRQGVKAGVPDVCLPVPRGGYHGLYIEMKRRRGSVLSQDQREYIEALRQQGYRVEVCKGFHPAADLIEEYLSEGVDESHV